MVEQSYVYGPPENDPNPFCQQCGGPVIVFTLNMQDDDDDRESDDPKKYHSGSETSDTWACEACRLLWDDDQVFDR